MSDEQRAAVKAGMAAYTALVAQMRADWAAAQKEGKAAA